ncbi:MAG: MotE family protein [Campylobacterota bacterium]
MNLRRNAFILLIGKVIAMFKILFFLLPALLFAQVDCNKIFEQRKGELILELERIDEQKQSLEALKDATESILDKKEKVLNEREAKLEQMMDEVEAQKEEIEQLVAKNEDLLEQIKEAKMTKVSQAYAQMKPRAASGILESMDLEQAIEIMQSLDPEAIGDILAQMGAQRASEITRGLKD